MTVTKQQAMSETRFHYSPRCDMHNTNPKGATIERWRANGACKTWKRDPERFQLPIKYGLRGYSYLTNNNARDFHTEADCPHGLT